MKLGTATHCAILEPERFNSEYVAMPEGIDRRTTAGKQAYADLLASGAEILAADDMAQRDEHGLLFPRQRHQPRIV
jgi:hypothetical protein